MSRPGVELVEHRDLGPQDCELEGLDPLLLATGEIDVERTCEELVVETEPRCLGRDPLGGDAVGETAGRQGLDEDFFDVDAGHLDGILQTEEQARPRSLPRREPDEIDAVEGDRTSRDLVTAACPSARAPASTCPSRWAP